MKRSPRSGLTVLCCVAVTALGAIAGAVSSPATAASSVEYAVARPVCAKPANPTQVRCMAVRRVTVAKGTNGAVRWVRRAGVTYGPKGGYTPNDLASAYGYNPNVKRTNQTVAVIDWHDNPNALRDLNHFDSHYHLPTETARSFRKVNQSGHASPLPVKDRDAATETSLDLQAVRAVCHTCKILLVEAQQGTLADLAAAVNTAARLGATEISNSYGMPEPRKVAASVLRAYNHPGIPITVSTGDDGWYGWDWANAGDSSDSAPSFPSTASTVVAVGGTTLRIGSGGTRTNEYVWNSNGADDSVGAQRGPRGASGGGCSKLISAPAWQKATTGYASAGCQGKRLGTDVSAIADPLYGFDVYDSYGVGGWATIGGTSLSAPVVAAMYALAGGSGGTSYPASSLYTNRTYRAGSLYDVTLGGTAFCAGDTTANCETQTKTYTQNATQNPNSIGAGLVDCSFPGRGHTGSLPAASSECNATTGFDGASGVGSPKTISAFSATTGALTISHKAKVRARHRTTLGLAVRQRVPGTRVTSVTWYFGDGRSTAGTRYNVQHTWKKAGSYPVTVRTYDSRHQYATTHVTVRVR